MILLSTLINIDLNERFTGQFQCSIYYHLISDSVHVFRDLLVHDVKCRDVAILFEKHLTSIYFIFQGEYYKQFSRTHISSSLSSVVADRFMETFEEVALQSFGYKLTSVHSLHFYQFSSW